MSSFVTNLALSGLLNASDIRFLDETLRPHLKTFEAGHMLARSGTYSKFVHLIQTGWAYRYKCLRDGRSLITAFVIPGDVSDLDILPIGLVDHEMACLTAVVAAELPQETFDAFFDGSHPRIAQAIEERAILSNAIQREGMVNVGLRTAPERIAHLFCELFHRMRARGLTDGDRFAMPLTQNNIADAVGLSLVHVNRRLQDLRTSKLVSLRHRQLIVHDLPALESLAFFDPAYLGIHNRVDTHLHRDTAPSFF